MNLNPTSQSMSTELLLETHTGSLLSNLDEATRAEVLGKRFIECPLVMATECYPRMIQEELMKCAYLDIEQGCFIRTKITQGASKLGPMGHVMQIGYIIIGVKSYDIFRSHLVCLWLIGRFPKCKEQIDHINGNRQDDRPSNLRLVSHMINGRNVKKRSDNTSGYTGVIYITKLNRYLARTIVKQKTIRHGLFATAEEAFAAREAYIEAHPELGFTDRHGR